MRVLFVVNPEKTIFQYLVPLAWALRTAGHEVRVASQPAFADVITQAGLTAVPVGRNRDLRMNRDPDEREEERPGISPPYDAFDDPDKATWEYLEPGMAEAAAIWHRYGNFPVIADLVGFARHWKPDLVLWEPLAFAGGIAAAACGAAHGRVLFGVDVYGGVRQMFCRLRDAQPPGRYRDPLADWVAGYARKYGFKYSDDILTGQFTVDQFPASLQTQAPGLHYLRMQYIPYGGPATIPTWLWTPPERPRVALTLGLTATEVFDGYNIPLADILHALADLDIDLIATVAEHEQPKLGPLPPHTRIVSYVPWHALAPTCSTVIHHAGAATLATTARHPVPHLALHYHFDQPLLARKLATQGAGLEIHTSQATPDTVRDAVQRLLTEPHFHHAATALRDEIHQLPTPNQLVPHLEDLTH